MSTWFPQVDGADPLGTPETAERPLPAAGARADRRQCGRCRDWYPADPDVHPTALPEWWLCPDCHTALLGATIIAPRAGP